MNNIKVVVESPKGSVHKYVYDPSSQFFRLKRLLPDGLSFPYDFGFIPGTRGEDGDPLDVMIIAEFGTFTGCQVECRLIGGLKVKQTDTQQQQTIRNDRFFAIPLVSEAFKNIVSMEGLPEGMIAQLQQFFTNSNIKEHKTLEFVKILSVAESLELITDH